MAWADVIELARIIPETTQEIVRGAVNFLSDVLGQPIRVSSAMLTDTLMVRQWRNRIELACEAERMLRECGVAAKITPPEFLLPLLEASGNVEDPDLRECWARLLASGVADVRHAHPAFVQTLRECSAVEARILSWLHAAKDVPAYVVSDFPSQEVSAILTADRPGLLDVPHHLRSLAFINLERLGVVTIVEGFPPSSRGSAPADVYGDLPLKCKEVFKRSGMNAFVEITSFGTSLAEACIGAPPSGDVKMG